ncbi:MAG: hypothetical protein ACI86M_003708 [Saprospiraceae bacterium]|jgi:hypothetical protein
MLKGFVHHTILISVVIMSMMFIYSSMTVFLMPGWSDQFAVWGYSQLFLYFIGSVELIIAVAVFARPTRTYGLFGLIVIMIGALYTHLTNDQPDEIYAAIFMLFLAISTLTLIWFESKIVKGEIN